ncbi:MAG: hypothetical protein ACKVHE_36110, partial [Planctomycetales bacterium]
MITIPILYQTQDATETPAALAADGFTPNLHYDSSVLTVVSVANVLPDDQGAPLGSAPTNGIETQNGTPADGDAA